MQGVSRLLGDLLQEATGAWHSDEPIGAYVAAAARDLQHVQHVLALEAESAAQHEPDSEERRQCLLAGLMSRRIGKLAAELEKAR